VALTRPRSPDTKFGTGQRSGGAVNRAPGPGAYGIPAMPMQAAPAYSIRAR
jgi:hypothetical protein